MKKKRRDRSAGRPSILDLQMMFLKSIGDEAPDAVRDLFLIENAEEWARKYHASAKWLVDFASMALRLNWQVICLPIEYRRRIALDAWKMTVSRRRQIVSTLDDAAFEVQGDFDIETLDKREAEAHCRWLAMWLFGKKMTTEQFRVWAKTREPDTVIKGKNDMARILGFNLPNRRGRPRNPQK